jgi:CheY-like chemotaxis protein
MKPPILFPGQPYIIYADDDADDRAFFVEMMRKIDPLIRIFGFENGLGVVQFLESLAAGSELPCCVVLDLNMPVWDGIRTLRVMKEHHEYVQVPVYIFSTSTHERDIAVANSLGAAEYIPKPYSQKDLQGCCEEFASHTSQEKMYKRLPKDNIPFS